MSAAVGGDPLLGVPLLEECRILPGQRWIYSAGFNVTAGATGRIDAEAADLRRLAEAGARIAVLSHQGDHRDGSARPLPDVAEHLSHLLGRPVGYCPENASAHARREARRLRNGEVMLFGNTRLHAGEQRGDPHLARAFAGLGERVAVGGFSKAHRSHASNTGVLAHLPGWAAQSITREVRLLAPWAGRLPGRYSVAVLGGRKPEKTLLGLAGLITAYDLVVPAGVVLNTVLRVLGYDVGDSDLGPDPQACAAAARRALDLPERAEVHLPREVVVAPLPGRGGPARRIDIADGVPAGHRIVDFTLQPWLHGRLRRLSTGGRALVAGTPTCWTEGFRGAGEELLGHLRAARDDTLLLGGDTVADLPWRGPSSTGGGSALQFLVTGTCSVLEALRRTRTDTAPPAAHRHDLDSATVPDRE